MIKPNKDRFYFSKDDYDFGFKIGFSNGLLAGVMLLAIILAILGKLP